MAIREGETEEVFFEAVAELSIIYESHPMREEECHGRHFFDESEEIDRSLLSFKILLGDKHIDLTERLTEEEKRMIL